MNDRSRLDLLQGMLGYLGTDSTDLAGNQGSLYPALHRLEHQGWIKAEWGISELGRRARFYRLTAGGRKQLEVETETWAQMTAAIGRVVEMA
jgi:PadR family transcriptional regulator PadR